MPPISSRGLLPPCSLGVVLVCSLFCVGITATLQADTTFDSGTTTISTGTDFGDVLYVGYSGTATMNVIVGGSATNKAAYLGYNSGSRGTVSVTGGTWTNGQAIYVGFFGGGTLNVDGGSVTVGNQFYIGSRSTGALNVNGGYVSDFSANLGFDAGSNGTATVTSGTWATALDRNVGYFGTGTLNVNGGYVSDNSAYIGVNAGANGTVTVTGGTWATGGTLYVGQVGTGVLTVNGGHVSGDINYLGVSPGSNGTATVTGGTWATNNSLYVGYRGNATLSVHGSGVVSVAGTISEGSFGTIAMGSGGQLTAAQATLSNTTTFRGDPVGTGFGTITATAGLAYGGVLGLNFGKFYDEGTYNLFSFASLTPSGSFSSLLSTGAGTGSVYDSMVFTNDGFGLWAGTALNGQTITFDEASGVLSFSAVPEPSAFILSGVGVAGAWLARRQRERPFRRLGQRLRFRYRLSATALLRSSSRAA